MKTITAGSKVRLVHHELIPVESLGTSLSPTAELLFRVITCDHEQVRVRGINRETPLGEHVWPVQAFALVEDQSFPNR